MICSSCHDNRSHQYLLNDRNGGEGGSWLPLINDSHPVLPSPDLAQSMAHDQPKPDLFQSMPCNQPIKGIHFPPFWQDSSYNSPWFSCDQQNVPHSWKGKWSIRWSDSGSFAAHLNSRQINSDITTQLFQDGCAPVQVAANKGTFILLANTGQFQIWMQGSYLISGKKQIN